MLVWFRMHENGNIWEVVIVIYNVSIVSPILTSTIKTDIVRSGWIRLLVKKCRVVEQILQRLICHPFRSSAIPFVEDSGNYDFRK